MKKVFKVIGKTLMRIGIVYLIVDYGYIIYRCIRYGVKNTMNDIGDAFHNIGSLIQDKN